MTARSGRLYGRPDRALCYEVNMKNVSFIQKYRASTVEVAGLAIPLFFTMGAAAEMEDAFGESYLRTINEMLQIGMTSKEAPPDPMPIKKQAQIICILARSGGADLEVEDLMQLHTKDFAILARAAQEEIIAKSPWAEDGKKKQ